MNNSKTKQRDLELATQYAAKLKAALGDNLISVTLFGSRARGDAKEGSDFDFIVTVKAIDDKTRDAVTDINVEMMNISNELFSGIVYDKQQWSHTARFPFGWNVQREGISF